MLRALGYEEPARFHMNEGHAALLTLELLSEQARKAGRSAASVEDLEAVRQRCVFTTHTPVPAGHDKFPLDMVDRVLGHRPELQALKNVLCCDGQLNLTYLALNLSCYVNGVAKKHSEVSRLMFAGYAIDAITNGVHAATWTVPSLQQLFDRYLPGWRQDNFSLRYAGSIPLPQLWEAHRQAKRRLLGEVNRRTNQGMDMDVLTLGFARRATAYKRADLLFTDPERLRRIARRVGPLQVVYAGKAHPADDGGKAMIRRVFAAAAALHPDVRVVYLPEYDMALARLLCAGADVWLNTPQKPQEASGTSGMKAAVNGVPSLSVLDGWWVEGHLEGVTGWAVGEDGGAPSDPVREAASLCDKLEYVVLPLFYGRPLAFAEVMRSAAALNGSFFNAQRMMAQYVQNAYQPATPEPFPAAPAPSPRHAGTQAAVLPYS
jgi:starch phosphorylase